jgi:DNA primase large subunit
MADRSQLEFAQRYPFSTTAKAVVQHSQFDLKELPEQIVNRAALLISTAWKKKEYRFSVQDTELLENEILAFPVAKIIISFLDDHVLYERFSQTIADSAFHSLEQDKHKSQVALQLAKDLGLQFTLTEKKGYFVSMPVLDFLQAKFSIPNLKLVNQSVDKGVLYLTESDLGLFVSQLIFAKVRESVPVKLDGIPAYYKEAAKQIKHQLKARDVKEFEMKLSGKIKLEYFAPCMKQLYTNLAAGENVPHMARFDLATFLIALGMPVEQIDTLFSKAPNYSQKTTLYHLNRIKRLELSPPSAKKIQEHGYCPLKLCENKHPLLYYRKKLMHEKQEEKKAKSNP